MGQVTNKKAYHEYNFSDTFEAGLVLTGAEIKAIRAGRVNLKGSYGKILYTSGTPELFLIGAHIADTAEQYRSRKLLVHKKELNRLIGALQEKGQTLIATKLHINGRGLAKVSLSLGRGKQLHDKREALKKRDIEREIRRDFKSK